MAPKYEETNNTGFSFLNILKNPPKNCENIDQNDTVYVHPMVKRSTSALSSKSLEMCTESLGSETGSDVSENGDDFYQISLVERERIRETQRSKYRKVDRKIRRNDFPPPLTSISGSDKMVKVKHHREGGRLVIKAVSFSNRNTNFLAERSNGKLKLTLFRNRCVNYENERVENEEFKRERLNMEEYENERVEMKEYESERGEGELKMVRRCKEGGNRNKVFANWRSSCVAIS